jgi:CheY-like chemotaxis protein
MSSEESPPAADALVKCDTKRLLVVDDEQTILRLFKMILTSSLPSMAIDLAANGREAVEFFKEKHHCMVLMDLHMPVMDGRAAFGEIDKICQDKKWQVPAVVFCTGFSPPSSVRDIISQNPLHCLLSKPVTSEVLVSTIESRLEKLAAR